jgi:hypothetical protein
MRDVQIGHTHNSGALAKDENLSALIFDSAKAVDLTLEQIACYFLVNLRLLTDASSRQKLVPNLKLEAWL